MLVDNGFSTSSRRQDSLGRVAPVQPADKNYHIILAMGLKIKDDMTPPGQV